MNSQDFLSILSVAEKLKCNTRHSDTSSGRRESVAEHSWRIALMAMLLEDEFTDVDVNKVIKMCLIHDLGEAFTGDIATFNKTEADSEKENRLYEEWIEGFPEFQKVQFKELLSEMSKMNTKEAKLYKALDKLEAVIQHNEADISTWLPLEYDLQLTYGAKEVAFSPYLSRLKEDIDSWTRDKIKAAADSKITKEINHIEVRTMNYDDIPLICKADNDESEANVEYLKNQLVNQDKKECSALVALYNGEVAGYVFLYYKCRWGAMANCGIPGIVDLIVFEKYRKNGVASALMDEAEEIAKKFCDKVYLDVCLNSEYGPAHRFYIKRGYVPDGKGVYYEEKVCELDADCKNDDELTLCLVKELKGAVYYAKNR